VERYKTILADPPWEYGAWGKNSGHGSRGDFSGRGDVILPMPYPTMKVKDIMALPVSLLADINCELYLWTTQKYLPSAFDVIKAWGFKYCQVITWCKKPRGLGQGGLLCPTTEFLLLSRKGGMPKFHPFRRIDTTWFLKKRPHNSHSTKPDFFRYLIERLSIPPRIELFARRKVDGWDCWGNEVESDIEL